MRILKKVLALVMAMAMIMSVTAFAGFTDEAQINDNYAEAVAVLNGMGIYQGYPDESFRPNGSITRAEVAAIMYRISTQDVEDEYVGLYAGIANFSDVAAADWFAGYVGYCANAGFIKGYPDGTFKPQGLVTGFEALAMILRAMGYDAENEFSGMLWTDNIAKIATKAGIMDELNGDEKLANAADRELVAQMVFTALADANVVDYTLAYGYRETKAKLGDAFGLKAYEDNDDWGRPGYGYEYKTGDEDTFFAEAPIAVYSVAISECQVATDLDEDEKFDIVVYDNGKDAKYKFDPIDTDKDWGAQGTLIEVYEDELVIIDNYLGKVTKNVDAKYDGAGHLKADAYSNVNVWMDGYNEDYDAVTVEGTDYAKDTWVIVNYNEAEKYFEIAAEAESFVGAQDKIWKNSAKHTIDDETYMDAVHFYKDDAKTDDAKYTWFLDPYGNLIGSLLIEATYNHAVLKDLIWVVGKPGYAEATLVYMDGTEETVEVAEMDGACLDDNDFWCSDDCETDLADRWADFKFVGEVSSDSKYNGVYEGYALYKIEYNKDGSVNLHGVMGEGNDKDTVVYYADDAEIDTRASVIRFTDGREEITTATEFLVREEDADGNYVYEVYDIDTLPEYDDGAEIFYTLNSKGIVNRVYVKAATLESEFGYHLFTTTTSYARIAGENTYEMDVLVDGVERTIETDETTVKYLAANKNKLFHVVFDRNVGSDTYGYVADVRLVNEYEDGECCNFLDHGVTVTVSSIFTDDVSYRYDADTKVYGKIDSVEDLDQDVADDYSIWVIEDEDSRYVRADVIYVGTKLSADATAKVNKTEAVEGVFAFEVPANDEDQKIAVAIDVKNANTLIEVDETVYEGDKEFSLGAGTYTFKVYAEDGCGVCVKEYRIVITNAHVNPALTALTSAKLNGEALELPTGYAALADAVKNAKEINLQAADTAAYTLTITTKASVYSNGTDDTWADVDYATSAAAALTELEFTPAALEAGYDVSAINDGSVIVICLEDNMGADLAYFAYIVK